VTRLSLLEIPVHGNRDGASSRKEAIVNPTTRRYLREEKASLVWVAGALWVELRTELQTE
jgi:hypothetical protein